MFFFNWERSEALSVAKGAGCKRSELLRLSPPEFSRSPAPSATGRSKKRLNPVGDSRRRLRKNETFI